jgi:hypothetical protein
MSQKHADFSPSSAGRYFLCPGAMLEEKKHPNEESEYAAEGTMLHDLAEKVFNGQPVDTSALNDEQREAIGSAVNMATGIRDDILGADAVVHTELPVKLAADPRIFGTVDIVMYAGGTLVIDDHKFGRGVNVSPVENKQLMVYAQSAIDTLGIGDFITDVVLAISQPRTNDKIKTWGLTAQELNDWVNLKLVPQIELCYSGSAPFAPGEDQCRFCNADGSCEAQNDAVLGILNQADALGDPPGELPASSLSMWLGQLKFLRNFCSTIEAKALAVMESGVQIPGFKLVRGRSSRKWVDESKAENFLKNRGLKEKERYKFTLLSAPQAEKALKGKLKTPRLEKDFQKLIHKPEGKVTYAPDSDPREAVIVTPPQDHLNEADAAVSVDDLL